MSAYRNPWATLHGSQTYHTDAAPIMHAGAELYHVAPKQWDVVRNGECISQRGGKIGAMIAAEVVADMLMPTFEDVRTRMFERYGHL